MEILELITMDLMFISVVILALAPLLSAYGTFRIGQVFWSDSERPRNRILSRMFWSGLAIAASGFYIAALAVGFLRRFFDSDLVNPVADFGTITFAWILIVVLIQPFLNWVELGKINGGLRDAMHAPETEQQQEDRHMGEHRSRLPSIRRSKVDRGG